MEREVIRPGGRPVSPVLSAAIRYGDFLFVSGQVGADPTTGAAVAGGFEAQARQTLENLKAVLEAAGSSLDRVLKTTCFITDMGDFSLFNEVYKEYFDDNPPARSTFQVAGLVTPYVVEIEAIAAAG